MKKNPFISFLRKYTILSLIGLAAIIICFLYYITWDCEELFHNAGVLFEMIYTISVSYIVSLIFYFFQVFLPNYKKEDAQRWFLKHQIDEILLLMNKPFKELFGNTEESTYDLSNITEEAYNNLGIKYDKPIAIYRYHRQITAEEYMEECVDRIDCIIKDLLVHYVGIMNSVEYPLLQKIYQSNYHCFVRDNILNPSGQTISSKRNTSHVGYAGIVLENWEYKMISEYQELYSELLKLK